MKFDQATEEMTNILRESLQKWTETIDEGESVAIGLWYSFILDHATHMNIDPETLAREQLEAFLQGQPPVQLAHKH